MRDYQPADQCLQGKIIAVTGAGAGIGRALAIGLARYGATIILMGRTVERLENVYDEIEAANYPQPAIIPIDFESAKKSDYKHIATNIEAEFGKLDGLIHNAAELGARTSIANYSLKLWDKMMSINVTAPFALTKYMLPLLRQSQAGSIVFTSSTVGLKGRAYWGAYAASKATIENLMQTLADELENTSNIRVNTINPGATRTAMRAQAYPAENPGSVKAPEELVPLYTYFMSDASIGTTKQQVSFS